jgi:hypothetical protein
MGDETLKKLEEQRALLIRQIEKEKGALKVLLMSSLGELEEQITKRKGKVEQFQLRSSHEQRR